MMFTSVGILLAILTLVSVLVPARTKSSDDLTISIYQVDERNSVQNILQSAPNTDIVLDTVHQVRLECSAPFPVQWIYIGNGVPTLSSTIRKEAEQKFTASVFITLLKEGHTGRYECISTESSFLASAHFYLFVPGQNLFMVYEGSNTQQKRVIYIPKNDSNVRIPCAVSDPKIPVVLEKSIGDVLVAIKPTGSRPAYMFNPREGFNLNTRQISNPEGSYVCTAVSNGVSKIVEFELSFPREENYGFSSTTQAPVKHEDFKCSTHTDCPPNWSCYTDLVCRDPCLNSIRCGTGAVCKYNDRRPYCECPQDFLGDPMKECFNSLQGSQPGAQNPPRRPESEPSTTTTDKPQSGSKCKENNHCSSSRICINGNCIDPCAVAICDKNAYCVNDNKIATCLCSPSFIGKNGRDCRPAKYYMINSFNENEREQSDAIRPRPANSETSLLPGPRCSHNRDCPVNTICRSLVLTSQPICAELCGARVCGENAFCQTRDGTPACLCRRNFSGNPYQLCLEQKIPNTSLTPARKSQMEDCFKNDDCADDEICESGSCQDACLRAPRCRYDTECRAERHVPTCLCPRGQTGSAILGCSKNDDRSSEFRRQLFQSPDNLKISGRHLEVTTQSSTLSSNCSTVALSCGPNSECRIVDERPTCFCLSDFIGEPPRCRQECVFNIECPADKACVQNRCRNSCSTKCGKNTQCRMSSGEAPTHRCSCREGYEGDPLAEKGCYLIRDH